MGVVATVDAAVLHLDGVDHRAAGGPDALGLLANDPAVPLDVAGVPRPLRSGLLFALCGRPRLGLARHGRTVRNRCDVNAQLVAAGLARPYDGGAR